MKITKSELKEMIREALREALNEHKAASRLKESVWTCFFDGREVGTVEAATEHDAKIQMMDKYPEHPYGLYDGCFWVEPLTEGAFSGGYAGDNSFSGGTIRGRGASVQPSKKSYLTRLKRNNPDLVDITVIKVSDIKPGMITQAGQVKTAEVRNHNSGVKKMYIMHTNNYDGFWGLDETMEVMVDPDDKSKPFTGSYSALLKRGLKESVDTDAVSEYEPEDELEEGIFGNKYKGMDILVYRGDGKDEAIAIASNSANNHNLINFQKAHAKKNNNDESDYVQVSATDVAVKKYKKALKAAPDVTSNLPQWVKQYVKDTEEQNARDFKNAEIRKEREAEAARKARRNNKSSEANPDDEYIYIKGNGTGTYKYRESVTEALTVDSIFENLY